MKKLSRKHLIFLSIYVSSHILLILLFYTSSVTANTNLEEIARKYNDPTSYYLLAEQYAKGRGVVQNDLKAIELYKKAAKLGHTRSKLRLGKIYYYGLGIERSYPTARKWLKQPAENGSSTAQYLLGMIYLEGKGTKKDVQKAIRLFQVAAEDAHGNALFQLGRIYYYGIGVEKDIKKATSYLRNENTQGIDSASALLGQISEQTIAPVAQRNAPSRDKSPVVVRKTETVVATNIATMKKPETPALVPPPSNTKQAAPVKISPEVELLLKAKKGDATAQYSLGMNYRNGKGPFKPDQLKSIFWLEKAANKQHPDAQFQLGMMNYKLEENANYVTSPDKNWLELAAQQGHTEAQYYLGSQYASNHQYPEAAHWLSQAIENGNEDALDLGVELLLSKKITTISQETTKNWLILASKKGLNEAQYQLGELFYADDSDSGNIAKAYSWLKKAAAKGHMLAQYRVGEMYLNGKGIEQRYSQAIKWIRKSANQGYADAQFTLAELYRQGQGLPKNKSTAKKWYKKAAEQGHGQAKRILGRKLIY